MEERTDQEVMDDFLDSVRYVGHIQDWRLTPETDSSEDEPEGEPDAR